MRGLVIRGCVIIIIESCSAIVSSYVSYWAGKQYKKHADLADIAGTTKTFYLKHADVTDIADTTNAL